MSLRYIRRYYGVPARQGATVQYQTAQGKETGKITSGTRHVIVRPDKQPSRRLRFHPDDLEYEGST